MKTDSADTWEQIDGYLTATLHSPDPVIDAALARCEQAGLPDIQVSAPQGKFLHLLVKMSGARRILEVGTLGGYSTLWLALALPENGHVTTIELEPEHARVARENFAAAGETDRIELREGVAAEALAQLEAEAVEPFDFVFIDADKPSNVLYLESALKLSRPGAVIVLDNVIRAGDVLDSESDDAKVQGSRAALDWLGNHPKIESTALQTVGEKGYDGFALGVVLG